GVVGGGGGGWVGPLDVAVPVGCVDGRLLVVGADGAAAEQGEGERDSRELLHVSAPRPPGSAPAGVLRPRRHPRASCPCARVSRLKRRGRGGGISRSPSPPAHRRGARVRET